jgi:hypothetical protein
MAEEITKDSVYEMLREIRYCSLASQAEDKTIDLRMMTFTNTKDLKSFYMLSPRTSKKIKDFIDNRNGTLLAYTITDNLEDFVQIVAKGKINIHIEPHSLELKNALEELAGKLELPAGAIKDAVPGDSVFLELKTNEIGITRYKDILHDVMVTKIAL